MRQGDLSLQTDPTGYDDGLNWYAYVGNDPLNRGDPAGTAAICVTCLGQAVAAAWDNNNGIDGQPSLMQIAQNPVGFAIGATKELVGGVQSGWGGGAAGTLGGALRVEGAVAVQAENAMARGVASETRVLGEMGLAKNTQAVTTAEGKAIPDALSRGASVEIKDTARVSATRQVRIQTDAARASGRQSVLVTGTNTKVTGPAQRRFDQIIRRDDLGPQ